MKYGKREFQNRKKASVSQPKLFFGAFRRGNPPVLPGEEKSFRMRLSEGKQILESKRLNEKEI